MGDMFASRAINLKRSDPHTNATGGWSLLEKTVREIDESKVKDCKEDIDTLLVFAGLFSAVLTAFTIESYKTLQQDPATVSVQLLQQISIQLSGLRAGDSALNDTGSPSSSNPLSFEPPLDAIRVNVLWFASLIFSLTTASLGMLVKQWLREFLGGEYVGPKARLRVRHFRNPGLARWRVFEIAAVLPLLLQISLGLFFIGLCFFTSSVHPSIGNTSLPLVSGWSIFLLTTTVLPIFSSRCPYKSPFLKGYISRLRPRLHSWWMRRRYFIMQVIRAIRGQPTNGFRPARFRGLRIDVHGESFLAITKSRDVAILSAVDEQLLDDDFFDATLADCLQESAFEGQDIVDFLMESIVRRMSDTKKASRIGLPADLRSLSPRAWGAMARTVMEALNYQFKEDNTIWEPWIESTILLLLSPYSGLWWKEIVGEASEILHVALKRNREGICNAIASAQCFGQEDDFVIAGRVLRNFDALFEPLHDEELEFSCLEEIFGRRMRPADYQPGLVKLSDVSNLSWRLTFTDLHLWDLAEVVATLLKRRVYRSPSAWMQWMTDAMTFVVDVMSVMDDFSADDQPISSLKSKLVQEFCSLLFHPQSSCSLLMNLSRVAPNAFTGGNHIVNALQGLYRFESGLQDTLTRFNDFMKISQSHDISPIRLVNLAIRAIRLPDALSTLVLWRELFDALSMMIECSGRFHSDDNMILAEVCMMRVHALECNNADFSERFWIPLIPDPLEPDDVSYLPLDDEASYINWRDSFDETTSLFPDSFVHALSTLARNETRWYRVRRLKEMGRYVMSP